MCNFLRQGALRALLTIFQQNGDVLSSTDKLFNPERINVQYINTRYRKDNTQRINDITTKDIN